MIGFPTIFAVCVTLILTLFLPIVLMILFALKCKCKGLWATAGLYDICYITLCFI